MPDPRLLAIAEMLIVSSAQIYAMSHTAGLTAAQWSALRYFDSANASAANLASFARHHGTTKGTASRTVSRLVEKGALVRTQDGVDKRRRIVQVTSKGKKLLAKDPVRTLADMIHESDVADLDAFAQAVFALLKSPRIDLETSRIDVLALDSVISSLE